MCQKILQIGRGGGQKLNRLRRKVGAVLIEFAFAIPVFLVLLYYIHDLPKQKLMQRKMQFVANEIAAILQNTAKQRSGNNSLVTNSDLVNAVKLANLSIYPGTTQYTTKGYTHAPLGYFSHVLIAYAKSEDSNISRIKWWRRIHAGTEKTAMPSYTCNSERKDSIINLDATTPSGIYPTLFLSKGEAKIIVQYSIFCENSYMCVSSTNTPVSEISKRKLFGYLLYEPQVDKNSTRLYFTTMSIFTPVSNAFSETPPK